jgi:N-acetyl-gamma-glutamylphosphate reductase
MISNDEACRQEVRKKNTELVPRFYYLASVVAILPQQEHPCLSWCNLANICNIMTSAGVMPSRCNPVSADANLPQQMQPCLSRCILASEDSSLP